MISVWTIAGIFSTSIIFQASQDPTYKSEAPLAASIVSISPNPAKIYQPVEIELKLAGTWSNAFDPRQVDIVANVLGAEDMFSIQYGFLFQAFVEKLYRLLQLPQEDPASTADCVSVSCFLILGLQNAVC